jgi:hypothetical protein
LNHQAADTLSERPRWLSACIALVVCVTASAAGASLVRSLKQRPKVQAAAASATAVPLVNVAAQKPAVEQPAAVPSSAPKVVDVESLTVERKRSVPRSVRVAPRPVPTLAGESSDESAPAVNESTPIAAAPSDSAASEPSTSSDLPPAARSNPYGSGSLIDQIKKATAEEDGQ